MEKGFASALAPAFRTKKTAARAALVGLDDSSRTMLAECFRQFGIESVVVTSNAADRLRQEKFEACVLRLGPGAESVMEAARSSPSNSRMVIYGLGGNAQEAMRYSKYGINAMLQEPVERPAAFKLVRATHLLVLHEFRRYARIPVMTEVSLVGGDGRRITATSIEVSSGGMSLKSAEDLPIGTSVEVSFTFLTLPRVWVRSVVSWRKGKSFGVRFYATDDRRQKVKEWIDAYLES
ncbi:MAG: PilZ domain-containing protein [Candidatus Sulfotelmatobacter sp.]